MKKFKNIFSNYYKSNTSYAPYESVLIFFIKKFKEIILTNNKKHICIFEFGSGSGNNLIFIFLFILGIKKFNYFYDFKIKNINLLNFNIYFPENNYFALKKFNYLYKKIIRLNEKNSMSHVKLDIKYSSLPKNIDIFIDRGSLFQHNSYKFIKGFIKKLYVNMNNNSYGLISTSSLNHYSSQSSIRNYYNLITKNKILALLKDFYIEEFCKVKKSYKKDSKFYNTESYEITIKKISSINTF